MHSDFINSEAVVTKVKNTGARRFDHWPTKRVRHALQNLKKMKKAFQRCGSEDDSYSPISTLSSDVCQASDEILSAFSQWAETHLHACRNNQVHTERMDKKWYVIYNSVLGCAKNTTTTSTTTTTTTTTTTSTKTTSLTTEDPNPNTHRFCEILDGWTAECSPEQCYTYVHEDNYFYSYETYEYYYEDFTCEYTVSSVCDPNFADKFGNDCDWYRSYTCEHFSNEAFLAHGLLTAEGFKTGLSCPACGCDENGQINMNDRVKTRSVAGDFKKFKKN